jgi:hypothetical protein
MDVTLVVLAIVVALVAIDGIARQESRSIGGRLDERKSRPDVSEDAVSITTPKIVVDLTGRDRD